MRDNLKYIFKWLVFWLAVGACAYFLIGLIWAMVKAINMEASRYYINEHCQYVEKLNSKGIPDNYYICEDWNNPNGSIL